MAKQSFKEIWAEYKEANRRTRVRAAERAERNRQKNAQKAISRERSNGQGNKSTKPYNVMDSGCVAILVGIPIMLASLAFIIFMLWFVVSLFWNMIFG